MADDERKSRRRGPASGKSQKSVQDVVAAVTVKALKEFETGDMPVEEGKPASRPASKAGSRPGSARPGSAKGTGSPAGSRPGSASKERPPSAAAAGSKPPSRPGSAAKPESRPASAAGSKAGTPKPASPAGSKAAGSPKPGSRPASATKGSRPGSAAKGSRPPSQAGQAEDLAVSGQPPSGSRPGSAGQPAQDTEVPPAAGSRPGSAARPASGAAGSRAGSGGRTASGAAGSRTGSAGRPASGGQLGPGGAEDLGEDGGWAGQHDDLDDDLMGDLVPQQTTVVPDTGVGGGGGSEGDSDEDEEEEEEMDDDDIGDDSDGENEMVVLDPDHPLMRRFQRALSSHLHKQDEKVTLELRELQEAVKTKRSDRENLGVELYGVQQELARHQMMLEKNHDVYAQTKLVRTQMEQKLGDVRDMYKNTQLNVNQERKKGSELQSEVENLALRIYYLENAKEDVRSDIAVMRRAAEKADTEVAKAESEKHRQDLFVDRLVERVDKLREEISMYEAQMTAQSEETKATKDALSEAQMELEAINLEKKQLFQQWNSSLIGMRRRDEAHSAMQEALNQQQQRIMSLETEIDGYKRSIQKEQENNEKLTLVLNKTDSDMTTVKRLLQQCHDKHDGLKSEYSTYTRMLHETEQALNRANTDRTLRQNEVNALRKQIEREYLEKVNLEDAILEKMRGQMTMDKASKYTDTLTQKLRQLTKDLEAQVAQVENTISKDTLEISNTRTRTERLKLILKDLDDNIGGKNEIINRSDAEIIKRNAIIERKQGIIDQYNKRLEHMILSAGGVELGPLEITINSLAKSIEAEQSEIGELQQMWLRDQSQLVYLSKDKDAQSRDVDNLKKQLTILSQKKLRIESEINKQKTETGDLERNISHMQNDMLKLNTLLHKERGTEHQLQQGTALMENDFMGALREAELASVQMQQELESVKEEKERLLNSLVEAERQIMLWEKKTQLAKETRAAVDSEVGQGEIRAMKAEIHRMQVRYTQLMKQQERMIQEMEKAVSRRDTIVTRGDAQSKMNKKVVTKGTFQRQLVELKKKIKATIQDATSSDQELRELRDHQAELSSGLEERQLNTQQLQSTADTIDGDIDRLFEQKTKNLQDILLRQQKAKYFQQAKDGRYTRICKSDNALDTELDKQTDRLHTLGAIIDRLNQDFPHVQPAMRKVTLAVSARTGTED